MKLLLVCPPTVTLKLSEPPEPASDRQETLEFAVEIEHDAPENVRVTDEVPGE